MKYEAVIKFNSLDDIDVNRVRFVCCLRCGRRLKTADSQRIGFGKVCWQKQQKEHQTKLF